MAAVACRRNHSARHVALELVPEAARSADADTRVLSFEIRFVVNIAEAERPGIEAVFICRRRGSDNRAIQLGMSAHCNVEAAVTGKHSGLFSNGVKAALHLIPGGSDVT